jgi:hypothetical protein
MLSLILAVLAAPAGEPAGAPSASKASVVASAQTATAAEPGFHELQKQVSDLLKRESQSKNGPARAAAVHAMCKLHQQLVRDPRYSTSDVLKEYRAQLWSRLTKIKTELKQQMARNAKANKESLESLAALESAEPAALAAADSLSSSLALLNQMQGGPGNVLALGGGPVPPDFGPDLVDLIERTINPSFWDVVGGPGSIVYYAPLQCLVVRASAEVHGNVGGVIRDLRAAK